MLIEQEVGHGLLEFGVLALELAQATQFSHAHPGELALPSVGWTTYGPVCWLMPSSRQMSATVFPASTCRKA